MFESLSRTGYIVVIVFIIGVAFLSQQPYAREYGKKASMAAISQGGAYLAKLSDWTVSSVKSKIK